MRALLAALLILFAPLARADVTVFAAASTMTALEQVAAAYEAQSGARVVLSFAGSSALARQIAAGAPADLFVSANPGWMDRLEAEGWIAPGTRRDLVGNRLVLVGHGPGAAIPLTTKGLRDALDGGHLAMALVDAVPAGIYGRAALETLELWDALEGQVAQTDNVRAALMLVATGAAPLGIVYATDAAAEPRVSIRAALPEGSHPPITYPVAVIAGSEGCAAPFLAFLDSDTARAIFAAQGFTVPAP